MFFAPEEQNSTKVLFYGRMLFIDQHVLMPREKTEATAKIAIAAIQRITKRSEVNLKVADIGTGSGALIITIAKELEGYNLSLYATDISNDALDVARLNANLYAQAERICFYYGDLLDALPTLPDVIVANLPYSPRGSHVTRETKNEPEVAIFDRGDGTWLIKQLFQQISRQLSRPQVVVLENAPERLENIANFVRGAFPTDSLTICTHKDHEGNPRVLEIIWPSE